MKRSTRILALALLLALCLSTLGIFSAFAEDANSVAGAKTLFSQNGGGGFSVANNPADMEFADKTATNDVGYKTISYKDGWSVEDGGYTKVPYVQFAPGTHYLKDGWRNKATAAGTDDTDYLVIDMDISTDTNQFDKIYFQTLFYYGKPTEQADGSLMGVRTSAQSGSYSLYGDSGEDVYFAADKGSNLAIDVQSGAEWAHITMVVDATADTNRTMHLYYNGQFIDSRVCMTNDAVYLESVRISLGTKEVAPDMDNETFSFANTTIKAFPKGYTGELAEEKANLGSALYPISSFEDLGYCLENLPENTVAEITHADETVTKVTRISEIDGNLKAGDTVKLYRDIARKIVVPGKTEGDAVVPAVTFELNGHSMVSPLALADYDELDWIIRDEGGDLYSYEADGSAVYAKGAQVYTDGALTTDNLSAYVTAAFPKSISGGKVLKFTFLKDTTIKYTAALKHDNSRVTYDLNGNTLTSLSGGKVSFQTAASTARVIIRDGKMVNGTSNPLYMDKSARYYMVDVDLTVNNSVCDQRAGILFFLDCDITSKNTIVAVKSHSGTSTSVVFDKCDINGVGTTPIATGNLASGGTRRGSTNNFIGVYATEAHSDKNFIHFTYYANDYQAAGEAAKANQNKITVSIQGSAITTDGAALNISIETLTDRNNSFTFAEGFDATTNVYIDACEFDAKNIAYTNDNVAMGIINDNNVTVGAYTAHTNLTVRNSALKATEHLFANGVGTGEENGATAITLCDGVKLSTNDWAAVGSSKVTVDTAEGVEIAHSSNPIYPYAATSDYRECTYNVKRGEETIYTGTFLWNGSAEADPSDITGIVAIPESTTEYYYTEWVKDVDTYTVSLVPTFKLSANLTALSDFDLNVYLSAGVNTDKITMTVDGNKVADFQAINIAGVDYLKAEDQVIKGITPELVEGEHVVAVSFVGGFGETVELTANVSAAKHLTKALESATDEGKAFAQAIINYVVTATDYAEGVQVPESLKDKATSFDAPTYDSVKWQGSVANVTAELNLGDSVRWVFSTESTDTFTVTYAGGTRKFTVSDGEITIAIRAINLLEDITITNDRTGERLTFNLAGYREKLNGNASAQTVVDSLYYYSKAAKAYAGK